jgi:hypothetical protein
MIIQYGTSYVLSPQQLLDCVTQNSGCTTGTLSRALRYLQSYGLESSSIYPFTSGFTGVAGACAFNAANAVAKIGTISPYTCTGQPEAYLRCMLLVRGPFIAGLYASTAFSTYTGGILTASSCGTASSTLYLQVVGYGAGHWILRGSFGLSWGEAGFARIEFGRNACGIANEVTFGTALPPI